MSEQDDIDAIAAEYVLGTIEPAERAAVADRRSREPMLDAAILAWEQRLSPLAGAVADVTPPAQLFDRITARLFDGSAISVATPDRSADGERESVIRLRRRLMRWRGAAITSSLLAACLALVIGVREIAFPPRPQSFVAVFQTGDAPPSFLLTIDLASREVTIRPVSAPSVPGKTYELWILAQQLGPAPHSLGLIGDAREPVRKTLSSYPAAVLQQATFGISVEPPGGSPTGRPTGPALHGRLYPAAP